jgi:hypothetical protein
MGGPQQILSERNFPVNLPDKKKRHDEYSTKDTLYQNISWLASATTLCINNCNKRTLTI